MGMLGGLRHWLNGASVEHGVWALVVRMNRWSQLVDQSAVFWKDFFVSYGRLTRDINIQLDFEILVGICGHTPIFGTNQTSTLFGRVPPLNIARCLQATPIMIAHCDASKRLNTPLLTETCHLFSIVLLELMGRASDCGDEDTLCIDDDTTRLISLLRTGCARIQWWIWCFSTIVHDCQRNGTAYPYDRREERKTGDGTKAEAVHQHTRLSDWLNVESISDPGNHREWAVGSHPTSALSQPAEGDW
jgi:hypothetical protein